MKRPAFAALILAALSLSLVSPASAAGTSMQDQVDAVIQNHPGGVTFDANSTFQYFGVYR